MNRDTYIRMADKVCVVCGHKLKHHVLEDPEKVYRCNGLG